MNALTEEPGLAGFRLPGHLAERIAILNPPRPGCGGEYVLYWAHHALRAHENPALEVAARLALQQGLPLLVYQGLGGRHRYNSDRHHRFILESARDFSQELESVGQRLQFHLPSDPAGPGPSGSPAGRRAPAWARRCRPAGGPGRPGGG